MSLQNRFLGGGGMKVIGNNVQAVAAPNQPVGKGEFVDILHTGVIGTISAAFESVRNAKVPDRKFLKMGATTYLCAYSDASTTDNLCVLQGLITDGTGSVVSMGPKVPLQQYAGDLHIEMLRISEIRAIIFFAYRYGESAPVTNVVKLVIADIAPDGIVTVVEHSIPIVLDYDTRLLNIASKAGYPLSFNFTRLDDSHYLLIYSDLEPTNKQKRLKSMIIRCDPITGIPVFGTTTTLVNDSYPTSQQEYLFKLNLDNAVARLGANRAIVTYYHSGYSSGQSSNPYNARFLAIVIAFNLADLTITAISTQQTLSSRPESTYSPTAEACAVVALTSELALISMMYYASSRTASLKAIQLKPDDTLTLGTLTNVSASSGSCRIAKASDSTAWVIGMDPNNSYRYRNLYVSVAADMAITMLKDAIGSLASDPIISELRFSSRSMFFNPQADGTLMYSGRYYNGGVRGFAIAKLLYDAIESVIKETLFFFDTGNKLLDVLSYGYGIFNLEYTDSIDVEMLAHATTGSAIQGYAVKLCHLLMKCAAKSINAPYGTKSIGVAVSGGAYPDIIKCVTPPA